MKNKSKNSNPSVKTIVFFICTIIIFLFQAIFSLIPISIFRLDIDSLSESTKICLNIFSCICALIIVISFYYRKLIKHLKDFIKKEKKKNILFTVKLWIINLIIMYGSIYILSLLGINDSVNNTNIKDMVKYSPIIMALYVVVLGPLLEEIVFRLSFKTVFREKITFILVSGIIFGLLHALSINNLIELLYLIPYCSSGIILAYIYYETDNIYYSFFIHALHNLITLLIEIITLMEVI